MVPRLEEIGFDVAIRRPHIQIAQAMRNAVLGGRRLDVSGTGESQLTANRDPFRPRIFGIGLNKTGTTSLHEVLTVLGVESLHWGGSEANDKVVRAIGEEVPLLTYLDPKYDAFSDIAALAPRFAMCDRDYPGSKFILTIRPIDDWLDSRRRHVERNVEGTRDGWYTGTWLTVDMDKWRKEWDAHHERVYRHFEGRDDMIEVDLTASPGWAPFCDLLGVAVPDQPFPWANRG